MSEEKIIARRNKLIEWTKTKDIRCTPFCETINENINSINYLLHELQQKENIIKEVREYANTDKNCIPKHIKDYINNLLDKENKC